MIGYYGFAPTAILPSTLPRSIRTGQPPNPVPCLMLGQLATDQNWIGKGIGTGLLKHALQRCVTAADLIGGRALIVNAVDIEAAAFWRRRGFIPSKDDPLILFRSIADIAASLRKTKQPIKGKTRSHSRTNRARHARAQDQPQAAISKPKPSSPRYFRSCWIRR